MAEKNPCMTVDCVGEAWCAVTCTADLLGRKWHPVIVHRLLHEGELGFNDLKREIDGVTSKVLSESLGDLEDKGIVHRDIVQEKPVRVSYSLTPVGEELQAVIDAMEEWGQRHLEPPEDRGVDARSGS